MKTLLLAAGLAGLTGVALGAFGAHALKATLAAHEGTEIWRTGTLYHLIHAAALLAVALAADTDAAPSGPTAGARLLRAAGACWLAGIAAFSGSLYWLALGGPKWLGPVTPLGGLALLAGWGLVIAAGWKGRAR